MAPSYLSPEERQRRIERNRKRLGLDAPIDSEAQPGVLERAGDVGLDALKSVYSGVIQPVLENPAVQTFFEYPRAGVTEAIQQFGEARDVIRERGVLAGLGHIGREQASTAVDWAADFGLPAEWGERLDPSSETTMGVELDVAKQEFKDRTGRDPTLIELYDLKAPIQDKHMPWLTERWEVGPIDMSKRFGLELGGEIGAAALETAATGGLALAAKAPLTAAKAIAMTGKTGAKATAQKVALQSMGQLLNTPANIDKAVGKMFGAVVGAPFRAVGFAARGAVKVPGASSAAIGQIARQARRIFNAQGVPTEEAYRGIRQGADNAADANGVNRVTASEIYDDSLDGPGDISGPWPKGNKMLEGLLSPKIPVRPTGVGAVARRAIDEIRNIYEKAPTFFSEDLKARFADSGIPLLRNLSKPMKSPRPTDEDRYNKGIARALGRSIAEWTDHFRNVQTSVEYNDVREVRGLIGLLEDQAPGLIVHSGKPLGKAANTNAKKVLNESDLVSGATLDDVYTPDDPTNFSFGDQAFRDRGILMEDGSLGTMLGHTPVADPSNPLDRGYSYVYANRGGKIIKNLRGESIAPDLFPQFDQVMERHTLYKYVLEQIPITVPGRSQQTAYDIVQEIAEIGKKYEDMDIAIGTPNVGNKRYVLYGEGPGPGPGHFPRAPIGRIRADEPGVLRKGDVEEPLQVIQGAPKVHRLEYLSSADAVLDGVVYPHPAQAIADRSRVGYERARLKAIGKAVRETSEQYGIKVTALEDILASKATTAINGHLDGVVAALGVAIRRQAARVAPSVGRIRRIKGKQSSQEWADLYKREQGIRIIDPDGWDRGPNFEVDWNKPITQVDFEKRMAQSTLERPVTPVATPPIVVPARMALTGVQEMTKTVLEAEKALAAAKRSRGPDRAARIKEAEDTLYAEKEMREYELEAAFPDEFAQYRELQEEATGYSMELWAMGQGKPQRAPAFGSRERVEWELDRKARGITAGATGRRRQRLKNKLEEAEEEMNEIIAGRIESGRMIPSEPMAAPVTPGAPVAGAVPDAGPPLPSTPGSAQYIVEQIEQLRHIEPRLQAMDTGDIPAKVIESVRGLEQQITKWEGMVDKLHVGVPTAKRVLTDAQFTKIQRKLGQAKENAEIRSKEIDSTMTTLTRFGFEGHYFPKAFADSILKTDEALRIKESPVRFMRWLAAINGGLRTMGATADLSGLGIQGLPSLFNDSLRRTGVTRFLPGGTVEMKVNRQGDSISAMRASVQAMANNGPEIMQEHWWRFDQDAIEHGSLTSRQLAELGLSIAETGPDLYVSRLGDLPLMRKFNRAFTHFGNMLRGSQANADIQVHMVANKMTLDQVIASGAAAQIIATTNVITGVGRRGFGGELGQFIFFAPRFMHARIKTMTLAAKGMLPGDKTLMQQVAARYMSRYIGTASFLTIAINEAQGKETDLNPIIRDPSTGTWRANPNFMRIRMGGLDVSLFGPYDTVLRLLALPAFVALNVKETGFSGETLTRAFRSTISAPITASAIDIITGEDPIGRAIRDPEADLLSAEGIGSIIPTLLERSTPFAVNDVFTGRPGRPSVRERFTTGIAEGDVGAVATAVTQAGLQIVGGRSTYETPSETLRNMTEEIMGLGPDDPRIRELFPENMPEAEIQKIWESLEGSWWSKLIDEGKNFRMSLSLRSAFGLGKEPTPTWEMVADDVRYKLEDMVEKGRFEGIMTAEAIRELKGRMEEAMGARSDDYSRYKVERDKLDSDEERIIGEMEDGFAEGKDILTYKVPDPDTGKMIQEQQRVPKGDTRAYLDAVNRMRGAFGTRRSNLVGPEGKYKGVTDLFEFANGTALGNLSTFDSDVYDAAEASYYKLLYEPTMYNGIHLASIVQADKTIDWDLRDQKLTIWAEQMKEKFPNKSEEDIQRLRVRVEKARKDKASPIAMVLLEMQDYIRDTVLDPVRAPGVTYYDIEKTEAEKIIKAYPRLATLEQYNIWKSASSKAKKTEEMKNPWLKALKKRTDTMRQVLLSRNPQAASILQAMGSGPADAYNRRALEVKTILQNYRLGRKNIQDMAQFLADVYNIEDLGRYR